MSHTDGFASDSFLHLSELAELEQKAGIMFGPCHRKWLHYQAPDKVRDDLQYASLYPNLVLAKQGFMSTDTADAPSASFGTIANQTTEVALWNPGLWGLIPAFDMRAGKVYKVSFGGVMGANAAVTAAWRARVGTNNSQPPTGTDLGISPTVTVSTIVINQPFYGEFTLAVRAIGVVASSSTMTGNGFAAMPSQAAATITAVTPFGGIVATGVDFTVAQGLAATFAWGSASTTNTLTCQWMLAQSAN